MIQIEAIDDAYSNDQEQGSSSQATPAELDELQARLATDLRRMAAKVSTLEQDSVANGSVLYVDLDTKLKGIAARILTQMQAMDEKIDRLIESNSRLTQQVEKINDKFQKALKSERRNRWSAVLVTILGVGAVVTTLIVFDQSLTQFWAP